MALFKKKNSSANESISINDIVLPEHIGIIMDGNGRWAQKRNLPRSAGHKAGGTTFRNITKHCSIIGIKHLTLYAFSTENWKRPQEEVGALMDLFKSYLEEALRDFKDEDIVVRFIGDKSRFDSRLQELIFENERGSANRTGMVLNIAMNYGGRDELRRAVLEILDDVSKGKIKSTDITEKLISNYLYTAGQPDPSLIIRPSGEYRSSNFLLWQSAYSEYYFTDVLWPDFTPELINQILIEFTKRDRRFGGV